MADRYTPGASNVETTVLGADEIILNMGPQHPSTHGVLRVKLRLDGEKVVGSECVIGYLHRGVEKIAEHRTYQQFAPYVDRMDYVAAVSNGLGYCEAVEKLMGVEAPPRARVIRTILTEMQRIASHLFWLGTHALDIGALTPLFYCLREREEILKIFEKYCGARLTTHAFRIGGLVEKNSVHHGHGAAVDFVVTDGRARVPVTFEGVLPALFREGQGVVAMGRLDDARVFDASEVLAKHDERYMPPDVVDALKRSGRWKEGR